MSKLRRQVKRLLKIIIIASSVAGVFIYGRFINFDRLNGMASLHTLYYGRDLSFAEALRGLRSRSLRDRNMVMGNMVMDNMVIHQNVINSNSEKQDRRKILEGVTTLDIFPSVYLQVNRDRVLSTTFSARILLNRIEEFKQWLWILGWSVFSASVSLILLETSLFKKHFASSVKSTIIIIFIPATVVFGGSYLLFMIGWWMPKITHLLTLGAASLTATGYYYHKQKRLSFTDSLTKLANRSYCDRYLDKQWVKCQQNNQDLSLILCKIDFFPIYLDTYGHSEGDNCLQQVASAIDLTIRKSDLVARYEPEKFVVVLLNVDRKTALLIANRIRNRLKAMQIPHQNSPINQYITISMGIASRYPHEVISPAELIAIADRALDRAQQQGGDRIINKYY